MSVRSNAVELDFYCAPRNVWDVLTDAARYKEWYGYPHKRHMLSVEPGFALGAKIAFFGRNYTSVVTAYEPDVCLALSRADKIDTFTITPTETGCRVSMYTTLSGVSSFGGTQNAREKTNLAILRQLHGVVFGSGEPVQPFNAPPEPPRPDSRLRTILSGLMQGYRSPLERRSTPMKDSQTLSSMIDNTEADVLIPLRSMLVAVLLAAALFTSLFVSLQFERSDIVPSSGLSVMESAGVSFENACSIQIGQSKRSLELMLSCTGYRVSTDEYYYSAPAGEKGEPACRIHVIYDAYGNVRRYGFIDPAACADDYAGSYTDVRRLLSAEMDAAETAEALGVPCSAFVVDKSGQRAYYFGRFDVNRALLSDSCSAELSVFTDAAAGTVDYRYDKAVDPTASLPLYETTRLLRRQYSSFTQYLADRAAYERLFLLHGKTRSEAEAIIHAAHTEYQPASHDGTTALYTCSDRCAYTVVYYRDEVAASTSYVNAYLASRDNTLLRAEDYALNKGMTYDLLCANLGVLPSAAHLENGTLTLCYGKQLQEGGRLSRSYELVVELDYSTLTVANIHRNW